MSSHINYFHNLEHIEGFVKGFVPENEINGRFFIFSRSHAAETGPMSRPVEVPGREAEASFPLGKDRESNGNPNRAACVLRDEEIRNI